MNNHNQQNVRYPSQANPKRTTFQQRTATYRSPTLRPGSRSRYSFGKSIYANVVLKGHSPQNCFTQLSLSEILTQINRFVRFGCIEQQDVFYCLYFKSNVKFKNGSDSCVAFSELKQSEFYCLVSLGCV